MTLVTLEEARVRLPELIELMASGEKVVIADGEKWVAALATPPPMPPTPEEIVAMEERAKDAIRTVSELRKKKSFVADGTITRVSPDTPEEVGVTASQLDFIRTVVESHDRDGNPLPADHPLRALIAKRSAG